MTLYFITGNAHKFREAQAEIPDAVQLELDLPEIQSLDVKEVVRSKLEAARTRHKGEFIVEDVSFSMDALGGLPGPFIKWFLKALGAKGLYEIARKMGAHGCEAKAVIGYAAADGTLHFFEGSVRGTIVAPEGESGFGWDPIFRPEGHEVSFAKMTLAQKNAISHRGAALDKLKAFMGERERHRRQVTCEKVAFTTHAGRRLSGVLCDAGGKGALVVAILHGLGSDKESSTSLRLQGMLNEAGVSTLRFDFFGHGESEGAFEDITPSEGVDDARGAIRFLRERGYARIGLIGSSFGGYAAYAAAAQETGIAVMALKCPVANFAEKGVSTSVDDGLDTWEKRGFTHYITRKGKERLKYSFAQDARTADAYALAGRITAPALIVHGDADTVVLVDQSRKMAAAMPHCTLVEIPGADHRFSKEEDFERLLQELARFMISHRDAEAGAGRGA